MAHVSVQPRAPLEQRPAGGWYREVTREQWMAFIGSYLGWALDGFDYTILTFLLVDVQRSFAVNATLAGLLGQVTLVFRVAGGIGSGTAADRWGRKGPLMFSILWYSGFAFLSGFSTSYGMLFTCRALFGIGMGGVWAAGMPLTLEHWPARLRGTASGMMQSGYSFGFLLSSLVYQFGYPLVNRTPDFGWRAMLWIGVLPALVVLFIMKGVKESPVWLERQRHLKTRQERDPVSLGRLFSREVVATTIHTSIMMGAFLFMYHSITYWYPTLLGKMHRQTLPFPPGVQRRRDCGCVGDRPAVRNTAGTPRRRDPVDGRGRGVHPALRLHVRHDALVDRCARHGILWRRQLRHRAGVSDRAVSHRRARGGRGVRVPRRRGIRIVYADAGRPAAGSRSRTADRDGAVHRRFRSAALNPGLDGSGDARSRIQG